MVYQIFNHEIHYDTARMNYFKMIEFYKSLYQKGTSALRSEWKKAGNINNIYKNYESVLDEQIDNLVNRSYLYLKDLGIYTYTGKNIGESKDIKLAINDIYDTFEQLVIIPYEDIEFSKEEAAQYRANRKKSRAKYHGYGWDMSSKLVNSTKAAAKNAVVGLGHSAVNAVGNLASSASAASQKNRLYNDSSIVDALCKKLGELGDELAELFISICENESDIRFSVVTEGELSQAKAISANIVAGAMPQDSILQNAIKSLQIWPYNRELLEIMIKEFGDSNKEVETFAADFQFDMKSLKKTLLDSKYKNVLNQQFSMEQGLLDKKQEIAEYVKWLGIEDETYLPNLQKKWEMIDKNLRTVEGKEYATREEANDVRDDIKLFDRMLDSVRLEDKNLLDPAVYQKTFDQVKEAEYKNVEFIEHLYDRFADETKKIVETQQVYKNMTESDTCDSIKSMFYEGTVASYIGKQILFVDYKTESKKVYEGGLRGVPLLYVNCNNSSKWTKVFIITTQQVAVATQRINRIMSIQDVFEIENIDKKIYLNTKTNNKISLFNMKGLNGDALASFITLVSNIIKALNKMDVNVIELKHKDALYAGEALAYTGNGLLEVKNSKSIISCILKVFSIKKFFHKFKQTSNVSVGLENRPDFLIPDKNAELQKLYDDIDDRDFCLIAQTSVRESKAVSYIGKRIRFAEYKSEKKKIFEDGLRGLPLLYINCDNSAKWKKIFIITTQQVALLTKKKNTIMAIQDVSEVKCQGTKVLLRTIENTEIPLCNMIAMEQSTLIDLVTIIDCLVQTLKKGNITLVENKYAGQLYSGNALSYNTREPLKINNLRPNIPGIASLVLCLMSFIVEIGSVAQIVLALISVIAGIVGFFSARWKKITAFIGCLLGLFLLLGGLGTNIPSDVSDDNALSTDAAMISDLSDVDTQDAESIVSSSESAQSELLQAEPTQTQDIYTNIEFPILVQAYTDDLDLCPVMVTGETETSLTLGSYEQMLDSCINDGVTMYANPLMINSSISTDTKWDASPTEWYDYLLTYDQFVSLVTWMADLHEILGESDIYTSSFSEKYDRLAGDWVFDDQNISISIYSYDVDICVSFVEIGSITVAETAGNVYYLGENDNSLYALCVMENNDEIQIRLADNGTFEVISSMDSNIKVGSVFECYEHYES